MLTRVDHIDLKVRDFEGILHLFKTMGMNVLREMPERGSVEMAFPGEDQIVFEIHRAKPGGFEGIHHIAFKSTEAGDLNLIKQNCRVEFLTERARIQHTGRTVSSFRDQNGLTWQLTD